MSFDGLRGGEPNLVELWTIFLKISVLVTVTLYLINILYMLPRTKKNKSGDTLRFPYPPPSDAQIIYLQSGLNGVLPGELNNILILVKDILETGKFNLELSYSLRQSENLDRLSSELLKSIKNGSPVRCSDIKELPIQPRNFPNFKDYVQNVRNNLNQNSL